MGLSSIEDVVKDAAEGKIFILVDDENRENEGDLCILGEFASPEVIKSVISFSFSSVSLSLSGEPSCLHL